MIEYKLQFAELILQIFSEKELIIENSLLNFIYDGEKEADVTIYISWDWKDTCVPGSGFVGEDPINRYYEVDGIRYCTTRGGYKGEIASTTYDSEMNEFRCVINEVTFGYVPRDMNAILRMIPMKEIFVHYGILFFHASQVSYKNKAIMFTAPSGTGKTTQAKLWEKYRDAKIICNDRTLIRRIHGKWYTYGYPIDGDTPVHSSAVTELSCPVILEQSLKNSVEKLGVAKAAASLMSQLVLDGWNVDERTMAMELILSLLEEYPVYLLKCTMDESAVEILERVLAESWMI